VPAPTSHELSQSFIETATLVEFQLIAQQLLESSDPGEFGMRVTLHLGDPDDEFDDTVEWGALAFMYVLAALSFSDARSRGLSGAEFEEGDQLAVTDFMPLLRYVGGELHFYADYVRGRRVKTSLSVQADGTLIMETVGRGKAPLRWIDRLLGKRPLAEVPAPGAALEGDGGAMPE
jgi:hypothetical protein